MSVRKIVLPEGMLDAAGRAWNGIIDEQTPKYTMYPDRCISAVLEAALQWLSENPIAPQGKQAAEVRKLWDESISPAPAEYIAFVITAWQRRMFLAPEVPDQILALLCREDESLPCRKVYNERIIDAFRRGQKNAAK